MKVVGLLESAAMLDFRLLGPLQVTEDGRPLQAGGRKQRALLALLLLNANRVVSTDTIIDALWGDDPPESAANAVQVYVSGLRKTLGPGLIETRGAGYQLSIDENQLDLLRVDRLHGEGRAHLAAGDAESAATTLRKALDAWRGRALDAFGGEVFVEPEVAHLEELRLAILEARVEADLALGRHFELVPQLAALVREHPLRERFRAHMMLALYRSGRQAEALAAYREAREVLIEELGLEPLKDLQRLEQAILNQDAALDLAPSAGAGAAAQATTAGRPLDRLAWSSFVGRETEMALLKRQIEAAVAGQGSIVLIAGEPGIGKTRLAEEAALQARLMGAQVIAGKCLEVEGAPPLWPWTEALRSYAVRTDPAVLRRVAESSAAYLATAIPEIGRHLHERTGSLPKGDPEESRFRLFEAMRSFLRNASHETPVVLLLEDIHWADLPTLLLLELMAQTIADERLLLIASYRDVEVSPGHPLSSTVSGLARSASTHRIHLQGLSDEEILEWIGAVSGQASDAASAALARALAEETEGNPFFVKEILQHLVETGAIAFHEGRWTSSASSIGELGIPDTVIEVINRRLRRLSEDCQQLLAAAAIVGRQFSLDVLQKIRSSSPELVLGKLDEAIGARIVVELPARPGHYRFVHSLFAEALVASLPSNQRMELHREAGAALEAISGSEPGPHLAQVARHFFESAPLLEAGVAAEHSVRAGEWAMDRSAPEEAERHYQNALKVSNGGSSAATARLDTLLRLAEAQLVFRPEAALETASEAVQLARSSGDAERLGRAAVTFHGASHNAALLRAEAGQTIEQGAALLREVLSALPAVASATRVKANVALARSVTVQGHIEQADAPTAEAVAMARQLGDRQLLVTALLARSSALAAPECLAERLEIDEEMSELQAGGPATFQTLQVHLFRLRDMLQAGNVHEVDREVAACVALAAALPQPEARWSAEMVQSMRSLMRGDFPEAERHMQAAVATGFLRPGGNSMVQYAVQLYVLRRDQGRAEEVEALSRGLSTQYWTPAFRCGVALITLERGDVETARREFDALAADDFAAIPRDANWLMTMNVLSEICVGLADRTRARVLCRILEPFAGQCLTAGGVIACVGSSEYALGGLSALLEDWDTSDRRFAAALALNRSLGARPWVAYTLYAWAKALHARGRPEEQARIARMASESLTISRELGMQALEARITGFLASAAPR